MKEKNTLSIPAPESCGSMQRLNKMMNFIPYLFLFAFPYFIEWYMAIYLKD